MKKTQKKPERRTTHIWGRWTPAARLTVTLVCSCGNKYIKTRKNQVVCLWCMKEQFPAR